jgi:ATP-dependent Zn protease
MLKETQTTYSSPLINESHVIWVIVFFLYSLLFLKMINQLKDMNGFKGKQKKDMDSKQSNKTFQDVGGNQRAKEAILEIIDFIKRPQFY